MVITGKIDPKTKKIDAENGFVEHSAGILDPASGHIDTNMAKLIRKGTLTITSSSTGKKKHIKVTLILKQVDSSTGSLDPVTGLIDSKYGIIDPKKATLAALNPKTGKKETYQGKVDPLTGDIHLINGVADPKTGRLDNSLGQIISVSPNGEPVKVTVITSRIDPRTNTVLAESGSVDHSTGTYDPTTGVIDSKYGLLDFKNGTVSTLNPITGKQETFKVTMTQNWLEKKKLFRALLDPKTGHIHLLNGVTDPRTGRMDKLFGAEYVSLAPQEEVIKVTVITAKFDPKSKKINTDKGG
ncbi:Protein 4.1 homolog [Eumeta japonica]|uniref:Protein 4.1 homolog n=1 Tax=Eumeta variegata TaxID=151549 RepID=A0A4C1T365_EUMVA|nr:Protein 4.1 homolog [Eumeta japonica]